MKSLFKYKWKTVSALKITILTSIIMGAAVVTSALSYGAWVSLEIGQRFEQLRDHRPSQIFALYPSMAVGSRYRAEYFESTLRSYGYRPASENGCLNCYQIVEREFWLRRGDFANPGKVLARSQFRVSFEDEGSVRVIRSITDLDSGNDISELQHPPRWIGSFSAGRIRTQNFVPLEEIPVALRLAVMGIEDERFLEHRGVSVRAILRAFWHDLQAGRFVQGGSTITQQLMKNLFFSREKVITRKFKEAFYALVAEIGYSKEVILEAYLNEVYLGQVNSHEIHGVNEAARYYFNQAATELTLSQSATLAAMIQAPNLLDPRRNPERVKQRRDLVLKRMLEATFILEEEYALATGEGLGVAVSEGQNDDIDYFLELAFNELPPSIQNSIDTSAHSIYLNLRPDMQRAASKSLKSQLTVLESRIAKFRKKDPILLALEGVLIVVDLPRCQILASQGGRNYRLSPFNRVRYGRRQSGSLVKPFVYLTALLTQVSFGPHTVLSDSPFEWSYDRKIWKPRNYDEKFRGDVTATEALEQSLNVPTARLAQQIGIPAIVETLRAAGLRSDIYPVPSLSLGSIELTPLEITGVFATLARGGARCDLSAVDSVFDENGNELHRSRQNEQHVFSERSVLTLLGMMKGVITRGTAKMASARLGAEANFFVGKTGTTSDYRDAWFVGFSPQFLVLSWVGYDQKESIGLTGASAALPIWLDFVQSAKAEYLPQGFPEP